MRITHDNVDAVDFFGLVLAFHTSASGEDAGGLHASNCREIAAARRARHLIRADVADETLDLLDRGYGVTLCRCARHAIRAKAADSVAAEAGDAAIGAG